MANFYLNINRQPNGDYEVHAAGCNRMPTIINQDYLGNFWTCGEAVREAKRKHPTWHRINGCYYCCNPCHTT